jgi:trehalose 6-phosphate phosphatase
VVLGDDVTDEDAFAVGAPLVFGIHVGKGPSLAPWRLAEQEDVDELIRVLIAAREGIARSRRVRASSADAERVSPRSRRRPA